MVDASKVEFREGHVVAVTFKDGTERDIDLEKYLWGPIFRPIRTIKARFRELTIDQGALTWPNGADICPDVLFYDLPCAGRPISRASSLRLKRWLSPYSRRARTADELALHGAREPGMSWFRGITITMKYEDGETPQFLATYESARTAFAIETLGLLKGQLSPRAAGFVREWAELHRKELKANWYRARRGLPLKPIPPLE